MLIGLSGRKRTGKDLVAKYLVREYEFTDIGFADAVYGMLWALNPLVSVDKRLQDIVILYGWEEAKDKFPEVRELLQRLGTEGGRAVDENLWVQIVAKKAGPLNRVVIPDVRFPNEAKFIEDSGGILIRLERPGTDPDDTHASETSLDDYPFTWVIRNEGTPEELFKKIHTAVGRALVLTAPN